MEVNEQIRAELVERTLAALGGPATSLLRLQVRGWIAYAQELVISWSQGEHPVSRTQLRDLLIDALAALVPAWAPWRS
jgi:hypothetical protein